jgi:hypothetical protein
MVAERMTAAAVQAERDLLDGEERKVLGGMVVSIGFTNATVKELAPRELEEVAAFLFALIERAPLKGSAAYTPHRMVLGALASELRGFAHAAGEPVGLEADLRAAWSQKEEHRIRQRVAELSAAFAREIDDALLAQAALHLYQGPQDDHGAPEEPDDAYMPPPPPEQPDAPAYVL